MTQVFPAERWLVIEDNLATRHSLDVKAALLAWPEIQLQFAPKDASWLNLIEPWWKQVKSLALKERRFETVDELQHALKALPYWHRHRRPYRWHKLPESLPSSTLGGYGSVLLPSAAWLGTWRENH